MDELYEFVKGPMFRFSFAVMLLGLARVIFISLANGFEAKAKAGDKTIPVSFVRKMTIGTVLPFRAFRTKPVYAVVSILFHIGLLLTPLLLFDHALLFQNSIGISWLGITLPKHTADLLSVLTVITAFLLLILRISHKTTRAISRKQDYLWLILLMIPFITGLICANAAVSPDTYKTFIIIHMLSGNIIFILLPFTKIAHCVLLPLSQWVTARAWKFVPRAGENVEKILGKEGRKL